MIIQGSNEPIVITFDSDVSEIREWSVSLYGEDKRGAPTVLLKHWDTADLVMDGMQAYAPLTEDETLEFHPCVASLEIKWLDSDNNIWHPYVARIRISGRNDKTRISSSGTQDTDSGDEG